MEHIPTMSAVRPLDTESIVIEPIKDDDRTLTRCESIGIDGGTPHSVVTPDIESCTATELEERARTRQAAYLWIIVIGAFIFCVAIAIAVALTATTNDGLDGSLGGDMHDEGHDDHHHI